MTNEETIKTDSSTDVDPPVTGSPIIIGGGGGPNPAAFCKFKTGDYNAQQRGSRTRFVHKNQSPMKKLKLIINQVTLDLSSLLATEDFEIEVESAGSNNDLNFFLAPQAVEFDTNTYRRSLEPDPDGFDVFQSEDSFASIVKISLQGVEIERKLRRADKFSLEADII
jgi:hypothetical protein